MVGLPVCGLNMFDCSFSIVAKKSVKVFFDGGVEGRSALLAAAEEVSAGLLTAALVPTSQAVSTE